MLKQVVSAAILFCVVFVFGGSVRAEPFDWDYVKQTYDYFDPDLTTDIYWYDGGWYLTDEPTELLDCLVEYDRFTRQYDDGNDEYIFYRLESNEACESKSYQVEIPPVILESLLDGTFTDGVFVSGRTWVITEGFGGQILNALEGEKGASWRMNQDGSIKCKLAYWNGSKPEQYFENAECANAE